MPGDTPSRAPTASASENGGSSRAGRSGPVWFARVLAESVLIVLSVLMALAVDEWRDQRARAARAETALASIAAELHENAASMERARDRHVRMMDTLGVYVALGRVPPPDLYLYGMFSPALVHSTAWASAREAGATNEMPYDLVLMLSGVYDQQTRYRALAEAMVEDIMRDVRREGMKVVMGDRFASFIPLQLDFSNREASLLAAYEYALGDPRLRSSARPPVAMEGSEGGGSAARPAPSAGDPRAGRAPSANRPVAPPSDAPVARDSTGRS